MPLASLHVLDGSVPAPVSAREARVLRAGLATDGLASAADQERQAVFATWDDVDSLSEFTELHDGWHVWLRPMRSQGLWRGTDPLAGRTDPRDPVGAVAVMTCAEVPEDALAVPACRTAVQLHDDTCDLTFSVWSGLADAIGFAVTAEWAQDAWLARFAVRAELGVAPVQGWRALAR